MTHRVAGPELLTIQIHAFTSVETSSTFHFGRHGIPAPTVTCAKVHVPK